MEVYSNVYQQFLATHNDFIYKHSIAVDRLWEENICKLIIDHLEPGTDFIDIGANIGLVTLGVRKSVTGTIHCFECDNQTFNFLRYNMREHNNIKLYNFGLSDKHNIGSMAVNSYNFGCNHISSTLDETFEYDHNKTNTNLIKNDKVFFSLVPLDFLRDTFTTPISVIKIDVEGLEYHVLKGAHDILLKHRPVIIIEVFAINRTKVDKLLSSYGYRGEYIGNEDYIYKINPHTSINE
jgi:FkbM family methyltransferase